VVAHPDDEDAATLTLLARGHGLDVTLLSLTRGESGANVITGDFFDRLGALRTLEMLRAARNYGVKLRFTRFADFGFSKNVEETWRNWDRQRVVDDVAAHIRAIRPHIVIARFQGTPRDGHGHHQASGMVARQAFEATSEALKLYSGNWRSPEPGLIEVDSGAYNPILGRSYVEIGREGYRWHRSQGMGSVPLRPGPAISYYRLLASRVPSEPDRFFTDGLGERILPPPQVRALAEKALRAYRAESPAAIAPLLADGLAAVRRQKMLRIAQDMDSLAWLERGFEHALALALGLEGSAALDGAGKYLIPGTTRQISTLFDTRGGVEVEKLPAEALVPAGWRVTPRPDGGLSVQIPESASLTIAHWRRDHPRRTEYEFSDVNLFGQPLPPYPLVVRLPYRYGGVTAAIEAPVTALVAPAVSVGFVSPAGVLPLANNSYPVEIAARSFSAAPVSGDVMLLDLPAGWTAVPAKAPFSLSREGEEARVRFVISAPPGGQTAAAETWLKAAAVTAKQRYESDFVAISYPGLDGAVHLAYPAQHLLRRVDVKVARGMRAGYVMGTGDDVPQALAQLGVPVEMLDATALAQGDLSKYNVILLGIRAYAAREDVKTYNWRLLQYVENGGVLIVQYNTQEYDRNFGPYPYTMTARAEEVSEENSPVTILEPNHPVFQTPNIITPADFEGWFEQRGSKFWTTWDARYTPLLETHDTGQAPQKGGWLVARHGKGLYVYCAYAWYRQLPFAIPGAFRLFANLVSLGAEDAGWRR